MWQDFVENRQHRYIEIIACNTVVFRTKMCSIDLRSDYMDKLLNILHFVDQICGKFSPV
jgi:hypothetical protein